MVGTQRIMHELADGCCYSKWIYMVHFVFFTMPGKYMPTMMCSGPMIFMFKDSVPSTQVVFRLNNQPGTAGAYTMVFCQSAPAAPSFPLASRWALTSAGAF